MKRIYKYPLDFVGPVVLELPIGAEILSVGMQEALAKLWALVDPDLPTEKRYVEAYFTGQAIPTDFRHHFLGTLQCGGYVTHVFEVK